MRRPMTQRVAILRSDGSFVCECTLRDVSATGARIAVKVQASAAIPEIPPEFILSLSKTGNLVRYCETIWQRDGEIGVRFQRPRTLL